MNVSRIHLALTHIPVVLCFTALAVLVVAMIIRNHTVTKTALYLFIAAAIFAIPVFFTGEPTAELIKNTEGINSLRIEDHENTAEIGFIIILVTGLFAAAGLYFYRQAVARLLSTGLLTIGFIAAVVLAQTAQSGGLIRHTEASLQQPQPPPPEKSLQEQTESGEDEAHEFTK